LVHYHAYGNAAKVLSLVAEHSGRIHGQINTREEDEVGRLLAEYQEHVDRLAALDVEIAAACAKRDAAKTKGDRAAAETALTKREKPREKVAGKLAERDEQIAEARRRAEADRQDVAKVGEELVKVYADTDELLKHARVVDLAEIEENEFNLNIPRYVDTFEPEPRVDVKEALKMLTEAARRAADTEATLTDLLRGIGYGT
jgi:type I restriction enzyme M protein